MAENHRAQIEMLLRSMERVVSDAFDNSPAHKRFLAVDKVIECLDDSEYLDLIVQLCRSTRQRALFINGVQNGAQGHGRELLRREISWLADQGAEVSVVCPPDEVEGNGRLEFLRSIDSLPKGEARVSAIPVRGMFIFDRRQALMRGAPHQRQIALVSSPIVLEPILRLTDGLWEVSCSLDTFTKCLRGSPDETSSRVLRLLSSGCTDEVAARELGCSVRTYRRHVASLLENLGAASRFEAGVKAAALKLVTVNG